jgi:hypothetical protein
MIADAKVAHGLPVTHIMNEMTAPRHGFTRFAVVRKQRWRPTFLIHPELLPAAAM